MRGVEVGNDKRQLDDSMEWLGFAGPVLIVRDKLRGREAFDLTVILKTAK